MTMPVFDVLPVPSPNGLANPPPWHAQQAATLDGNFAKLNATLAGKGSSFAVSQPALVTNIARAFPDALTAFPAGEWPSWSFICPNADVLSFWVYCAIQSVQNVNSYLYVGLQASGTGLVGSILKFVMCTYGLHMTGTGFWSLDRNQFNPGGLIVVSPTYMSHSISYGEVRDGNMGVLGIGVQ